MDDLKYALNIAMAWPISAENGVAFCSWTQAKSTCIWKRKTIFPFAKNSKFPASEEKTTSEVVAESLNGTHLARQVFIKSKSYQMKK